MSALQSLDRVPLASDADADWGEPAHTLFETQYGDFPIAAAQHDRRGEWTPDLQQYEEFILFFSTGKDSLACLLRLLELGVPKEKITLHHHLVDGREGSDLMDWPITESYGKAVARALGVRLEYSWRVGGIEREMLRQNERTAPVSFPAEGGGYATMGGERSELSTRRKFPQVSADLRVRWCSSSAKIEVGSRYLNNHPRFADGRKRLVVTGERAEESTARAHYQVFEPHRCDLRHGKLRRRWIDHWRAVHAWSEGEVWDIIKRHGVVPHPVYEILSRASCAFCIFGGPEQWATLREIAPRRFIRIANYEEEFGVTIHRDRSVVQSADRASPLVLAGSPEAKRVLSTVCDWPVIVHPSEWQLPRGAFRGSGGPT